MVAFNTPDDEGSCNSLLNVKGVQQYSLNQVREAKSLDMVVLIQANIAHAYDVIQRRGASKNE